jgi:hypothetical protein
MKRLTPTAIAAAGLLLGSSIVFAQTNSPGASGFAPGQQDRTGTERGASSFAPGQLQKSGDPGDAKNFAPGQRMKSETNASGSADVKTKAKAKVNH